MPEDLTIGKAIETLSQRENELPRYDDQEFTSALLLALRELSKVRRWIIRLGLAIDDIQDQIDKNS